MTKYNNSTDEAFIQFDLDFGDDEGWGWNDAGSGKGFVKPSQPKVTQGNLEGYRCKSCQEFYPMAELNQPDNTFKCYECRHFK